MPILEKEWEVRKVMWPPGSANAVFHDMSYLGMSHQIGLAQMFSYILGLSMFTTYCFHSHILSVFAIT